MKCKDRNSTNNQEIKGKFVAREVLTCFSYEMDSILKQGYMSHNIDRDLPTWEDVENGYTFNCPQCGDVGVEVQEGWKCISCDYSAPDTQLMEQEPQEIFEWWIITEYLYRKLKEKGQPVLEWGNNYYWGRCCTGQAILLDSVISDICEDMEILEGQKYDWSK